MNDLSFRILLIVIMSTFSIFYIASHADDRFDREMEEIRKIK